jgi:hypothetical protein
VSGVDQRRERELKALRERLSALRDSLGAVREGTRQLAEIEMQRRLTPQEGDRARNLRWEGERLRHELQLLRQRFEGLDRRAAPEKASRVRGQGPPRAGARRRAERRPAGEG